MSEPARQRPSGWVLLVLLLIPYLFFKLQALFFLQQAKQLEEELQRLRPALSARVVSEQLSRTYRACEELAEQVRRLDLKNSRLLEQLSNLPPSISLTRLENRARLNVPLHQIFSGEPSEAPLRTDLWIEGTLLPGARNPELVLVRWAQQLQADGAEVQIRRLAPSPDLTGAWLFELRLGGT